MPRGASKKGNSASAMPLRRSSRTIRAPTRYSNSVKPASPKHVTKTAKARRTKTAKARATRSAPKLSRAESAHLQMASHKRGLLYKGSLQRSMLRQKSFNAHRRPASMLYPPTFGKHRSINAVRTNAAWATRIKGMKKQRLETIPEEANANINSFANRLGRIHL